jgi:hypothetical protein
MSPFRKKSEKSLLPSSKAQLEASKPKVLLYYLANTTVVAALEASLKCTNQAPNHYKLCHKIFEGKSHGNPMEIPIFVGKFHGNPNFFGNPTVLKVCGGFR